MTRIAKDPIRNVARAIAGLLTLSAIGCSAPKYYHLIPVPSALADSAKSPRPFTVAVAQSIVSMEYESDALLHESGFQLTRNDDYRWMGSISDMSTKTIAECCRLALLTLVDVGQNQRYTIEPHVLEFVTFADTIAVKAQRARVTVQFAIFDEKACGGRRAIVQNTYTYNKPIKDGDFCHAAEALSDALTQCTSEALKELAKKI